MPTGIIKRREWWDRTQTPEVHHIQETWNVVDALRAFVAGGFQEGLDREGFMTVIGWARRQSAELAKLADAAEVELDRRDA